MSIIVLRKDRERREALFLLQMLALADAFYITIAIFRYPFKYLLADQELYMEMQVLVFSQLPNSCHLHDDANLGSLLKLDFTKARSNDAAERSETSF